MKSLSHTISFILYFYCLTGFAQKDYRAVVDTIVPIDDCGFYALNYRQYKASIALVDTFFIGEPKIKWKNEAVKYFNPYEFARRNKAHSIPAELRFYVNAQDLEFKADYQGILINKIPDCITDMYKPFYIKKTEVTNKEYREYVSWVKDSIIRTILFEHWPKRYPKNELGFLDYSLKYDTRAEDFNDLMKDKLYLAENSRFYNLKEIDKKKIIYQFSKHPGDTIAVYPDTLAWIKDFTYSFNEPLARMYFWHPAYDNYPVVGITYHQAVAYCKWKELQLNKELSDKRFYFKVSIPNVVQWEWVTTYLDQKEDQYGRMLSDHSFICDLGLTQYDFKSQHVEKDTTEKHEFLYLQHWNFLSYERRLSNGFPGNFIIDGAHYTYPVSKKGKTLKEYYDNPKQKKSPQKLTDVHYWNDLNGPVKGLGGNVSEWTLNNYDQWSIVFNKRQEMLLNLNNKSAELQHLIEMFWDDRVDHNGQLVVGGNWVDERYDYRFERNVSGMNAKTFVDPNKAHSTIGFRYVVIPVLKD
ncbi:SUMF1/EgtB/PvdO family nonheme iron enzyme [Bacteroidota bacterium]